MEIHITGEPKEIAALVLQLQERQSPETITAEEAAAAIRDRLLECREQDLKRNPPDREKTL